MTGQNIWIVDPDGSNPIRLTFENAGLAKAATETIGLDWSPDGTKIVYTEVPLVGKAPYTRMMDADGENKVSIIERIGQGIALDSAIGWSPVLGLTSAIEATSWGQVKKGEYSDFGNRPLLCRQKLTNRRSTPTRFIGVGFLGPASAHQGDTCQH